MKQFIKFLSITVIAFLFLTATAFAEKVTFVKEYNYNASDLDSKVSSRTIALEQVKRLLLEELGVYLISETEVKNFRLTKDQVTTYSAGVVSAEVVDEKWDGKTYYLKAKVSADPAEVTKSLQNIVNDKQKSKELEDVRKKAAEFSKEIEKLKKELEIAKTDTKKPEQKADAKKVGQYNEAVKDLSAIDWVERGYALVSAGKPEEAIELLTKAITLNPQNIEAYAARGTIYASYVGNESEDLIKALADFNKVVELDPSHKGVYAVRGFIYRRLGKYNQAITDITNAIARGDNGAMLYFERGISYSNLSDNQQALNDFNNAIKLNPKYVEAYYGRGAVYVRVGNYQRAIKDYNKAIELNPKYVAAYVNLGNAYVKLGNHKQAVKDYSKAIDLNPDYAKAYYNRAIAYANLGDEQRLNNDMKMAAKLGDKTAQDLLRAKGIQYSSQGTQQTNALCVGDIENCEKVGLDYYKNKEYGKAVEIFSKLIELRPFTASYFVHRGNCYLQKGDNASAISDFKYAASQGHQGAQKFLRSQGIGW